MVSNLNILLLITFGYFWSCGPQNQKYTFGGGICIIFSTFYEYYQPYQYMSLSLIILLYFTCSCISQDQKCTFCGGIYLNLYEYYQLYQEMILSLNILLLVTFGYFWSCGPQHKIILLVEGYIENIQLYMIIIRNINKWF